MVVPTLLTSVPAVTGLIEHIEVLALGNLDPRIHFAILSDFVDAPAREMPEDEAILEAARAGTSALNARFGEGHTDRFYLFHRAFAREQLQVLRDLGERHRLVAAGEYVADVRDRALAVDQVEQLVSEDVALQEGHGPGRLARGAGRAGERGWRSAPRSGHFSGPALTRPR